MGINNDFIYRHPRQKILNQPQTTKYYAFMSPAKAEA
jgi:hypothetical protein